MASVNLYIPRIEPTVKEHVPIDDDGETGEVWCIIELKCTDANGGILSLDLTTGEAYNGRKFTVEQAYALNAALLEIFPKEEPAKPDDAYYVRTGDFTPPPPPPMTVRVIGSPFHPDVIPAIQRAMAGASQVVIDPLAQKLPPDPDEILF